MTQSEFERLGRKTHRLVYEDRNHNAMVITAGNIADCENRLREVRELIRAGNIKMGELSLYYISEILENSVIYGPNFDYTPKGEKDGEEPDGSTGDDMEADGEAIL